MSTREACRSEGASPIRSLIRSPRRLHSSILFAGIFLIALSAPFETSRRVIPIWIFEVSNLEAVILAALTVSLAWLILKRSSLSLGVLALPALSLLSALAISALLADDRAQALRFCGRFAAGLLIYLMTLNALTSRVRCMMLIGGVTASAFVAAVLGIFEYLKLPGVEGLLDLFREGPFYAGGLLRASSTLQFPTIASMYLEIAFGLGLCLLLVAASRRERPLLGILAFVVMLALASAVFLTLSRAGWIVVMLQIAFAVRMQWRNHGLDRGTILLLCLGVSAAALLGLLMVSNADIRNRLVTESPQDWYRALIEPRQEPLRMASGEIRTIDVVVTNSGEAAWQPRGETAVQLSYHWLHRSEERAVVFEGIRSPLPRLVRPGESIRLRARVQAPMKPGSYRLAWDLLQEHRFWFSTLQGMETFWRAEVVQGDLPEVELESVDVSFAATVKRLPSRLELWRAAGRMLADRPLVGVGPSNFRLRLEDYVESGSRIRPTHSNNLYVELFASGGLIGGSLFLWMCWRLARHLRRPRGRWDDRIELSLFIGVSAAVLSIAVHGLVDYFLEFTPTYVMIWMTLGISAAFPDFKDRQHG